MKPPLTVDAGVELRLLFWEDPKPRYVLTMVWFLRELTAVAYNVEPLRVERTVQALTCFGAKQAHTCSEPYHKFACYGCINHNAAMRHSVKQKYFNLSHFARRPVEASTLNQTVIIRRRQNNGQSLTLFRQNLSIFLVTARRQFAHR